MNDKIEKVLKDKINPMLKEHEGWVELVSFDKENVTIRFRGACSGCGAVKDTLNNIVIPKLKEEIPEIKNVMVSEDVSDELIQLAMKLLSKK